MNDRLKRAIRWVIPVLLLPSFALLPSVHPVYSADNPQDQLKQCVADLQKNPNDSALREKIIRLAQTMKPAPPVPDDTRRFIVRGKAAFGSAKQPGDFQESIDEFRKASLLAPWVGDVYYNIGIAQEKAGQLGPAIQSFKLYLLASPGAPDAGKVRDLIYEIEYRVEKADKQAAEASRARAAEERSREEAKQAKLRSLESWSGIWQDVFGNMRWKVSIHGNNIDIAYYQSNNVKRGWISTHPCPWGWHGTISDNLDLSLTMSHPDTCSWTPRPPAFSWPATGRIVFEEKKIYVKFPNWRFLVGGGWNEGENTLIRLQ